MQIDPLTPVNAPDVTQALDPTTGLSCDWQSLPTRARTLFVITTTLTCVVTGLLALIPIGIWLPQNGFALVLALVELLILPLLGVWLARKQYRYTQWKLDAMGFSLRRGRLWQSEVCVPTTRVQHLDLTRGPLERRLGLATLVIHTAGTRDHAVSVVGLDRDHAELVRNYLARQLDEGMG